MPLAHTPAPWYRNIRPVTKYPVVYAGSSPNHDYCFSFHVPREVTPEQAEANLDFLLRAVNAHDALVVELKELRAWVVSLKDWRGAGDPPVQPISAALQLAEE